MLDTHIMVVFVDAFLHLGLGIFHAAVTMVDVALVELGLAEAVLVEVGLAEGLEDINSSIGYLFKILK